MKTTKTKPEPLERDIQKTIVQYLELKGIEVSVTDASRVWGKGGGIRRSRVDPDHPDLTCVLPVVIEQNNFPDAPRELIFGLAFYIEVKRPSGAIRDGQKEKLRRLVENGALCMIARNVDEVMEVVERVKGKRLDAGVLSHYKRLLGLNLMDRRNADIKRELNALKTQKAQLSE